MTASKLLHSALATVHARPHLISPVVDVWHVEVIDEHRHGFASRRTKCASHPFVDVTLDGALVEVNEHYDKSLHSFLIFDMLSSHNIVTAKI